MARFAQVFAFRWYREIRRGLVKWVGQFGIFDVGRHACVVHALRSPMMLSASRPDCCVVVGRDSPIVFADFESHSRNDRGPRFAAIDTC